MAFDMPADHPLQERASSFLSRAPHGHYIGGAWQPSASGEVFAAIDPATGATIAEVARGGTDDVDAAVAAARSALIRGAWAEMVPAARGAVLRRVADLLEREIEAASQLETLDQGKPFFVGRYAEIPGAIAQFRYFAGEADRIEGRTIETGVTYQPAGTRVFAYTRPEPVGVVAAIVPWNSPLVLTAMKLAPALAAGCTVVLKPAEDTSLTALFLAELFEEAGLPSGVLNVVTGYGVEVGQKLAEHQDVDKVAFTGSTATGRAIIEASKGNIKRVSLELGGKSPVIVMPDADLEAAIPGAANAIFFNGGQVCVAGSRLYLHEDVFDQVADGIVAYAKGMKMGHGLEEGTQMGPLVSERHAAKVEGFVEAARSAGAEILCGGERSGPAGTFYAPTVLSGVAADMPILREEVFGPVLVMRPFSSTEEVLAEANDSDYALAAGLWTSNLSTAHRLAEDLHCGTVWINTHSMYDCSLPIGGMKQSGYGRDSGREAMHNYLETKTVCAVV